MHKFDKTNTYKISYYLRYTKDVNYYQKELQGLRSKRESIASDPEACPHVLKKQVIRLNFLR